MKDIFSIGTRDTRLKKDKKKSSRRFLTHTSRGLLLPDHEDRIKALVNKIAMEKEALRKKGMDLSIKAQIADEVFLDD